MADEIKEKYNKRFKVILILYIILVITSLISTYILYKEQVWKTNSVLADNIVNSLILVYSILGAVVIYYYILKKYNDRYIVAKCLILYVFILFIEILLGYFPCVPYFFGGNSGYCGLGGYIFSGPIYTISSFLTVSKALYKIKRLKGSETV